MKKRQGIYGKLPAGLVECPPGAIPFSPLQPGALALEDEGEGSLASFAMLAPPGTLERRYALALALKSLAPGAPLLALAPKDKGGSRIRKELEGFGCEVEEESRSHHKICRTTATGRETLEEAIREGSPRQLESALWTQPGVFSWDRPDPGSLLLLRHLPPLRGRGADLGAGIGFLARAALDASPEVSRISLVEIDRRAVECAKKNTGPRAETIWADLREADTGLHGLDFVVTNPPFHDGGIEDRGLGQGFIEQAAHMLRPGGELWLVANKHLPYEGLLGSLFSECRLLAEDGGFKVYRAMR